MFFVRVYLSWTHVKEVHFLLSSLEKMLILTLAVLNV